MNYFITGTHTDAGKTFISGLLVKALDAHYWKPIQSGIQERDTEWIQTFAKVEEGKLLKERYLLTSPESPHSAAEKDNVIIDINSFKLPEVNNHLIVEGAGGLLVPINNKETIADIIQKLDIETILVVPTYLGCINHSLLTINEIKRRKIKLKAIIFNGAPSLDAQKIIIEKSGDLANILIPQIDTSNEKEVEEQVLRVKRFLETLG